MEFFEMVATVAVLLAVFALVVIRIVKKKKGGEAGSGNVLIDILAIAAPLMQQAVEEVNAAKADGEVSKEELIDLVASQLHKLLLEAPLEEAEKALITPELVRLAVSMLINQFIDETPEAEKTTKK